MIVRVTPDSDRAKQILEERKRVDSWNKYAKHWNDLNRRLGGTHDIERYTTSRFEQQPHLKPKLKLRWVGRK